MDGGQRAVHPPEEEDGVRERSHRQVKVLHRQAKHGVLRNTEQRLPVASVAPRRSPVRIEVQHGHVVAERRGQPFSFQGELFQQDFGCIVAFLQQHHTSTVIGSGSSCHHGSRSPEDEVVVVLVERGRQSLLAGAKHLVASGPALTEMPTPSLFTRRGQFRVRMGVKATKRHTEAKEIPTEIQATHWDKWIASISVVREQQITPQLSTRPAGSDGLISAAPGSFHQSLPEFVHLANQEGF
ncbi:hypothetical protein EYF80_012653 [Liparis tanakae]|uniref:Uncharacterized protein n=1 Tax=Liparis tanakae TaxID=230148 RepID=A0A4Z2IH42_9TELE|nr:hypothetical protein EYF80_012653 [Liparis tanakae]